MTTEPIQSDELTKLRKQLARKRVEEIAITSLGQELTKTLDLGEAIGVVNKFLWEMLDYSVSTYIVYNMSEGRFESRSYLKESVSPEYLSVGKEEIAKFIIDHSQQVIVGSVSAAHNVSPLLFGVAQDPGRSAKPTSSFTLPITIGDTILGAIHISSIKPDHFSADDRSLVEMLISIASVSIARIQTVIQSIHSRTEALVQSLSNAVIMFDQNKQVSLANPAATRFTGLPKEGYNLTELFKLFPTIPFEQMVTDTQVSGKTFLIEEASVPPFIYEVVVLPVKDYSSRVVGGSIILHDITHQKELERLKDEFVSIASHELRTPMTAIKGFVSMIFDGDYGPLSEPMKKPLSIIADSTNRLINLVNDMLSVSRIEAGRMKFTLSEFNLTDEARNILLSLHPIGKEKNIDLVLKSTEEYVVQSDKEKCIQIIHNLIGNSLKFTDKGTISVSMKLENERVVVFVQDTGIGISPADQKRLFEKFSQISTIQAGRPTGTGLGLYISRAMAKKLGGDLWIFHSSPSIGSTFAFSMPRAGSGLATKVRHAINSEAGVHPDQK